MKERMKVLIAYDGSSYAEAAINDVCRAGLPTSAEILVVSVMELSAINPPTSEFDLHPLISRQASMVVSQIKAHSRREFEKVRNSASKAAERLRARFPAAKINSEILFGNPADEILRKAEEWKADLIVVGSRGRSAIGRFFLGSVSQKIVESANCSVRVVHRSPKYDGAPIKIIAGAGRLNRPKRLARRRVL